MYLVTIRKCNRNSLEIIIAMMFYHTTWGWLPEGDIKGEGVRAWIRPPRDSSNFWKTGKPEKPENGEFLVLLLVAKGEKHTCFSRYESGWSAEHGKVLAWGPVPLPYSPPSD